jgi:hypothetical protein
VLSEEVGSAWSGNPRMRRTMTRRMTTHSPSWQDLISAVAVVRMGFLRMRFRVDWGDSSPSLSALLPGRVPARCAYSLASCHFHYGTPRVRGVGGAEYPRCEMGSYVPSNLQKQPALVEEERDSLADAPGAE